VRGGRRHAKEKSITQRKRSSVGVRCGGGQRHAKEKSITHRGKGGKRTGHRGGSQSPPRQRHGRRPRRQQHRHHCHRCCRRQRRGPWPSTAAPLSPSTTTARGRCSRCTFLCTCRGQRQHGQGRFSKGVRVRVGHCRQVGGTRTHAHVQARTSRSARAHTHAHTHARTHTPTHTPTHARTHAHTRRDKTHARGGTHAVRTVRTRGECPRARIRRCRP
jgi:hypothetical protein